MESDEKIKIEGDGYLISNDLNIQFPVKFEVEQIHTGKISGKCTLSGFKYEDILSLSQSFLKGETKNRNKVIIEDIFIYGRSFYPASYLSSWDEIPGNDDKRLI